MTVNRSVLVVLIFAGMANCVYLLKRTLNDGQNMPAIALGTYLGFDEKTGVMEPTPQFVDMVVKAIDIGWRHFDTASVYKTEKALGEAIRRKIKEHAIKRDDVYITTKLWNTHHRREQVAGALNESLKQLGLNHVDLYLMHWPIGLNADRSFSQTDYMDTWRGMEDAQRLGLTKSIGVSNFNQEQLARVIKEGSVKPAVLQIEIHPQMVQSELVTYAQSQDVVVMGYSPFGSLVPRFGITFPGPKFDDPVLVKIAQKYNKTTAQVVLRWSIDRGIVPVPKTITEKRLVENIEIFDFRLEKQEIEQINAFDSHVRFTIPSFWQNHPYYPFEKVENPIADPFRNAAE